jgi:hypothetical protein
MMRTSDAHYVVKLLQMEGFSETEAMQLFGLRDLCGCACWDCVIALNKAVRRHFNERQKTTVAAGPRVAREPKKGTTVEATKRRPLNYAVVTKRT